MLISRPNPGDEWVRRYPGRGGFNKGMIAYDGGSTFTKTIYDVTDKDGLHRDTKCHFSSALELPEAIPDISEEQYYFLHRVSAVSFHQVGEPNLRRWSNARDFWIQLVRLAPHSAASSNRVVSDIKKKILMVWDPRVGVLPISGDEDDWYFPRLLVSNRSAFPLTEDGDDPVVGIGKRRLFRKVPVRVLGEEKELLMSYDFLHVLLIRLMCLESGFSRNWGSQHLMFAVPDFLHISERVVAYDIIYDLAFDGYVNDRTAVTESDAALVDATSRIQATHEPTEYTVISLDFGGAFTMAQTATTTVDTSKIVIDPYKKMYFPLGQNFTMPYIFEKSTTIFSEVSSLSII